MYSIVYLPTFGRSVGQMLVNIAYMEHRGYIKQYIFHIVDVQLLGCQNNQLGIKSGYF